MMLMSPPQPNGGFAWAQEPWGRVLRCTSLPARHLFTSRDLMLRDDQREWEAAAGSLGVTIDRLLLVRQVHGTTVAVRRNISTESWNRPEADIIVSDDPEVAVGVRVADCAPLLLFDPETLVVGAVHAGWRGTAAGAAGAGVRALQISFGSDPEHIVAAIGPCLGGCCGEMGPEVVDLFRAGGHDEAQIARWFTTGASGKPYLDLERANCDQLQSAGLRPQNIHVSGLCTKTRRDVLHSYRGDGAHAGRLLAAIRAPARR
jgi:hypothetical protein